MLFFVQIHLQERLRLWKEFDCGCTERDITVKFLRVSLFVIYFRFYNFVYGETAITIGSKFHLNQPITSDRHVQSSFMKWHVDGLAQLIIEEPKSAYMELLYTLEESEKYQASRNEILLHKKANEKKKKGSKLSTIATV